MDKCDEITYGERIAEIYDRLYSEVEDATIDLLQELAGGGKVLELGIGTGRIALPLQQRGVSISGVDASPAMVTRLRGKPGGREIPVMEGNFVELPAGLLSFEIPAIRYAVFPVRPRNRFGWPIAIANTKRYAYGVWLPGSEYEPAGRIDDFEYHDERSLRKRDPEIDLYVAIQRKAIIEHHLTLGVSKGN